MSEKVVMNIADMIDRAIGTPELGVVDFNMLQSVLHVMAQQLKVLWKPVEVRGAASSLVQVYTPVNVQTVQVSEFRVSEGVGTAEGQLEEIDGGASEKDTLIIVERVDKDSITSQQSGRISTSAPASATPSSKTVTAAASAAPSKAQQSPQASQPEVSRPQEPQEPPSEGSPDQSKPSEATQVEVKPSHVTQPTEVKPQQSHATSAQSQPKISVAAGEVCDPSACMIDRKTFEKFQEDFKRLKDYVYSSKQITSQSVSVGGGKLEAGSSEPIAAGEIFHRLETVETGLDKLSSLLEALVKEYKIHPADKRGTATSISTAVGDANLEMSNIREIIDSMRLCLGIDNMTDAKKCKSKREDFEAKMRKCCERVEALERSFAEAMFNVQTHMDDVNQSIENIAMVNGGGSSPGANHHGALSDKQPCVENVIMKEYVSRDQSKVDYKKISPRKSAIGQTDDLKALVEMFETIQAMQEELKTVNNTAMQLVSERAERQHHFNTLVEQIELLKAIKMDKEDLMEVMQEKADYTLLQRKVSHDQFENACEDLYKGLENALAKLTKQESLWQCALDDIQREIENKLDKIELLPVKEFFNEKLKQLQENLKKITEMSREFDAAGTKKMFLRNVNCISCDAKAMMKTTLPSTVPLLKPLPPSRTQKAQLKLDLDACRKQQSGGPMYRNLNDWEAIEKGMKPSKGRADGKHLCNRYCGGSHTVTTPSQRVPRLGNFIKQWGPDVLPLSSAYGPGEDGKMYKVTVDDVQSKEAAAPPGRQDFAATPKKTAPASCKCGDKD